MTFSENWVLRFVLATAVPSFVACSSNANQGDAGDVAVVDVTTTDIARDTSDVAVVDTAIDSTTDVPTTDVAPSDTAVIPDVPLDIVPPDVMRPPGCGNGTREAGEQCDDTNLTNLDGCDSNCRFEQSQRVTYLQIRFNTDAACAHNAFGGSIGTIARSVVQSTIDMGISNGTLNLMVSFPGITDLTGANNPPMFIGVMNGIGFGSNNNYDGTNDLDWWYSPEDTTIDGNRNPLALLPATVSNNVLTAGPGNIVFALGVTSPPSLVTMLHTRFSATIGASSVPLTSTVDPVGGTFGPPGHLADENLDPTIQSFATTGTHTLATAGSLCSDMSAYSLSLVTLPTDLAAVCFSGVDASNPSLLDALVAGCTGVVTATQPDQVDVPSANDPFTLTVNPATHQVNGCVDNSNASVPLDACLHHVAYSSYFKFGTDRVILRPGA